MSSLGAESLLLVVLYVSGSIVTGHPVDHQSATGLDAALSNIANSVVVVHDETQQPANESDSSELHLQSANAIPPLQHIAVMKEVPHIHAGEETTLFSNDTDSKSVIELTVLPVGSNSSSIDDAETMKDEKDEEHTTELTTATTEEEESVEITTELDTEALTTVEPVTRGAENVTSVTVITVLHSEQGGQQTEEEIKETIKEVEAMPVILTVGV
ncbi:uncharacterized protein LOC126574656 [Anopheles aquasalis]|uniref:uncharacterized protein LOC126574656 n=1 Tax=Anopheles aquasalis TaxID=42839 RepID=UPI00215B054B|nr:uncharacterized protein LOC126574656 [Anopheles aquasalis]